MAACMISAAPGLPLRHLLLAIAVMAVWGTNFVVIRLALDDLPPLLFAALRFTLVVIPAIFFLKRPPVSWWTMAAYGLFIGAGQFGLLFIAMDGHITPGLASLIVQMQIFFTIGLFVWRYGEKVRPYHGLALLLGAAGLALIGANMDATITAIGLALNVAAAFSWACGNLAAREAGTVNMLSFIVWSSLFSAPPLYLLSLLFEGSDAIGGALRSSDAGTWIAVAWQAVGNTMFGYAAWGWLLQRHSAATVSPLALLVPVFGMSASAVLLGEPFPLWKLVAAGLVMCGLAIIVLYPHWRARIAVVEPA